MSHRSCERLVTRRGLRKDNPLQHTLLDPWFCPPFPLSLQCEGVERSGVGPPRGGGALRPTAPVPRPVSLRRDQDVWLCQPPFTCRPLDAAGNVRTLRTSFLERPFYMWITDSLSVRNLLSRVPWVNLTENRTRYVDLVGYILSPTPRSLFQFIPSFSSFNLERSFCFPGL